MPARPGLLGAACSILLFAAACGGTAAPPTPPASLSPPTPPGVSETSRISLYAADPEDHAGAVLAGDFNGDDTPDLLVTAAAADGPGNARPQAGEGYIFLGPFTPDTSRDAAEEEYDAIIYGAAPEDQLGRAAAVGDFNGDGIDDIALAAPFASPGNAPPEAGTVNIVFGSSDLGRDIRRIDLSAAPADVTILGADERDLAGLILTAADLNADGAADLIIGTLLADGSDNAREDAGEVYVLFGGSMGPRIDLAAGQQDITIHGRDPGDRLGEAVASGDVNGDGLADIIAVAPFAAGPGNEREDSGEVYIILSPPPQHLDLADESPDLTIFGVDPGDQIGHSVGVGDVDGDGFDDLWLGAVSADGPDNGADLAGEVSLVLGGEAPPGLRDTAAGDARAVVYGSEDKARLGRSATAADLNGDGLADLLIAAPDVDQRKGAIYVLYGRSGPARYPQTVAGACQ